MTDDIGIRLAMQEELDTAFLNERKTMNNRFWDRFLEIKGVLGDYLEERQRPEFAVARADWWLDQRKQSKSWAGRGWIGWAAQLPGTVNVRKFLPETRPETNRTPSSFSLAPHVTEMGTYERIVEVAVQVRKPHAIILNADWLLHFAPMTLRILGWSNRVGHKNVMLFTHVKKRGTSGSGIRKDIDVQAGGFVGLWNPQLVAAETPLFPEVM